MKEATEEAETEPVSCHICHQEIPNAEALSVEGQEYLYYFCGQGCYEHWHQQNEPAPPVKRQ